MAQTIPEPMRLKLKRLGKLLNALAAISPSMAGRMAFRIFCSPKRLPFRPKDLEFLSTATQDSFSAEGLTLRHYTWEPAHPNGRTAMFLHGWESNTARWYKFIHAALDHGFRVVAFDAPASGHSQGNQLNVLIYSRMVKRFVARHAVPDVLIGHSLGGAAAIFSLTLQAVPHPQKLVILSAFAESSRVIRDFAELIGANETVVRAIFRHIERRGGVPIEAYSVRGKAAELRDVQGLVLHDTHDEVAPVEEGKAIADAWGCRFVETTGYGHRMQDKQVLHTVMDFIK